MADSGNHGNDRMFIVKFMDVSIDEPFVYEGELYFKLTHTYAIKGRSAVDVYGSSPIKFVPDTLVQVYK